MESGLGIVEGSSRRNGGGTKGTPRSDVVIYQVSGGRMPFFFSVYRLSWEAKEVPPRTSLL